MLSFCSKNHVFLHESNHLSSCEIGKSQNSYVFLLVCVSTQVHN